MREGNPGNEVTLLDPPSNPSGMNSLLAGISGLRRSGSQNSLNSLLSVMDSMTGEQHFRTCEHCYSVSNLLFILIVNFDLG